MTDVGDPQARRQCRTIVFTATTLPAARRHRAELRATCAQRRENAHFAAPDNTNA
jgi:hypothetical protein